MATKKNPPGHVTIRAARPRDAAAIAAIYNYYVEQTIITFEEKPVPVREIRARIRLITAAYPWLVAESNSGILGYAYANKWKERAAYRHSTETTVYLHHRATGRGLGRALYSRLITELRTLGCHAIIGGVALPNEASVGLHEAMGFRKVAHFREVGRKFNRWIDVGYWQMEF